jgi:hypothetical protein
MLQLDSGARLQCLTRVDRQMIWVSDGHRSKAFIEHVDHSYLGGLHVGACTAAAAQLGINDLLN